VKTSPSCPLKSLVYPSNTLLPRIRISPKKDKSKNENLLLLKILISLQGRGGPQLLIIGVGAPLVTTGTVAESNPVLSAKPND